MDADLEHLPLIPAQAGIQCNAFGDRQCALDPRFRGGEWRFGFRGGERRCEAKPLPLIPAKAGIQGNTSGDGDCALDPRFRGGERRFGSRGEWSFGFRGGERRCEAESLHTSCPALCRASTSCLLHGPKTWMAGTSPAMTNEGTRPGMTVLRTACATNLAMTVSLILSRSFPRNVSRSFPRRRESSATRPEMEIVLWTPAFAGVSGGVAQFPFSACATVTGGSRQRSGYIFFRLSTFGRSLIAM